MTEEFEKDLQGIKDDELGKLTAEQMKGKLEQDVTTLEKYLEQVKKDKANYEEQFEVDNAIWELIEAPGMLRKIEPTFEFEKSDKYWELQEKKQYYRIRQDRAIGENQLKGYDYQVEELIKKLNAAKEKLKAFLNDEVQDDE